MSPDSAAQGRRARGATGVRPAAPTRETRWAQSSCERDPSRRAHTRRNATARMFLTHACCSRVHSPDAMIWAARETRACIPLRSAFDSVRTVRLQSASQTWTQACGQRDRRRQSQGVSDPLGCGPDESPGAKGGSLTPNLLHVCDINQSHRGRRRDSRERPRYCGGTTYRGQSSATSVIDCAAAAHAGGTLLPRVRSPLCSP